MVSRWKSKLQQKLQKRKKLLGKSMKRSWKKGWKIKKKESEDALRKQQVQISKKPSFLILDDYIWNCICYKTRRIWGKEDINRIRRILSITNSLKGASRIWPAPLVSYFQYSFILFFNDSLYPSQSEIGERATPSSTAALATATASHSITLGSKGFGTI